MPRFRHAAAICVPVAAACATADGPSGGLSSLSGAGSKTSASPGAGSTGGAPGAGAGTGTADASPGGGTGGGNASSTLPGAVTYVEGVLVSTLAGSALGEGDALGERAQFNKPAGIAVQNVGGGIFRLWVWDSGNFKMRYINPDGDTFSTPSTSSTLIGPVTDPELGALPLVIVDGRCLTRVTLTNRYDLIACGFVNFIEKIQEYKTEGSLDWIAFLPGTRPAATPTPVPTPTATPSPSPTP
ncbi:MAG: hypothetical protein FJZ00_03540, partial [Candidatus Sericytochromatia bacterium]|nr:hypothetical protein [Candidatus Tanganyikabacteria bacterium]